MPFPSNKTKIVCTIGPASLSPEVLREIILAGMNVARLNFSHGDFSGHLEVIRNIRRAAEESGRRVSIMADLPGPKIRIGNFLEEPVELKPGETFTLTTDDIQGTVERVSVTFSLLPMTVRPNDRLFLNDGLIQLRVQTVWGNEVRCKVVVGGELRSRKGLNLPGIDLGISAFTEHDKNCLKFALEQGVDAVSQSFVENADDVIAVREAAAEMGYTPFIIAKIERSGALEHIDEILEVADGIMVARGDLGVEIPIEKIAVVQKQIMKKANCVSKPVITATQMLESMTGNRRPTRAEATDVANAILDGTDCVMLSGESAMGKYPVASVTMLAKIAGAIEPYRSVMSVGEVFRSRRQDDEMNIEDLISVGVVTTLQRITPSAVIVPTRSGATARRISRFRLPVWIAAISSEKSTCQNLMFSYGIQPVYEPDHPSEWRKWIQRWMQAESIDGRWVVLTEGPSRKHPDRNNRMEIIDLK